MKRNIQTVALLLLSSITYGQDAPKVLSFDAYQQSVKKNDAKELINLQEVIPNVVLDIRYATTDNFVNKQLYPFPIAYARKPVAEALKKAQEKFKAKGLGIVIYDAYRPYRVTVKMFEAYPDPTYVASPKKGSRHNRGCAIDMGLLNLKTGMTIQMPTEYDSFQKEAWPSTPIDDPVIRKNRSIIIAVMESCGFKVNASEWWHYDFIGWGKYELLDVSFEELTNGK